MPVLRRTHVTDIADVTSVAVEDGTAGRKRKGSGLDAMLLPELKQLAGSLGIRGAGTMRKGQLIAAIQAAQSGSPGSSAPGSAVNGAFTGDSGGADGAGHPNRIRVECRCPPAGVAAGSRPASRRCVNAYRGPGTSPRPRAHR